MSLRERFIARLSEKPRNLPALAPDQLGHDVATSAPPRPRAELTDQELSRYTSWLASVTDAELAIAHPSLARYSVTGTPDFETNVSAGLLRGG